MIKSIEISNFRGLEACKIPDLGLINIFVGKNNSGKSTILDAVYLAYKEPLGAVLGEFLRERTHRETGASELFFAYDTNREVSISLKPKQGETHTLRYYIKKKRLGIFDVKNIGNIVSHIGDSEINSYTPSILHSHYSSAAKLDEAFRKHCEGVEIFLSSIRVDELTRKLDDRLSEIKRNRELEIELEKRIIDIYGEFAFEYVPRPENLADRRVAFKQGPLRIYSEFHGAGLQRSALLISSLLLSKDTTLLVEEIESFQHPEALKKLAKHMIELARKNNVQLFITTHSYHDALRFFNYAFEDEEQKRREFRSFVIKKQDGKVDVKVADLPSIIQEVYGSST